MLHQISAYEPEVGTLPSPAGLSRFSWGAILAGVSIATSLQCMLNLLGIGLGASTIDMHQRNALGSGLAIGTGLWFAASALISLWMGGWAAGHLAGSPNFKDGMLHGFTTWSITSVLTIFLLSSTAGGLIGGSTALLGKTGAVGQSAQSPNFSNMVSRGTGPADVQQQTSGLAGDQHFQAFATQIVTQGNVTPEAHAKLVALVSEKQGISPENANNEVAGWQRKLDQAKSAAGTVADKTASGVAKTALWSFAALFLGAVAATFGGMAGSPGFSAGPARTSKPARA